MTYTKTHTHTVSISEKGRHTLVGLNAEDVSSLTALTKVDSSVDTFTGDYNPRWKSEIRQGQSATTAASGTRYSGSSSIFEVFHEWIVYAKSTGAFVQSGVDYSYGSFCPSSVFSSLLNVSAPTSVKTDVTNRCIMRFLEEVNRAQTSGNLTGRSIKHFEHDMHSIISPMAGIRERTAGYLSRLMKVGTAYQRLPSRLKHTRSLISDVRAAYLEYTFGIKPFTEDMTDILTDLSRDRPDLIKVNASASKLYQGSVVSDANLWTIMSSVISGTTKATYSYKLTSLYQCRYRGAVRTRANPDSGKVSWLQDNNLLPKDWVPTLYHILPYTWMVDYFSNIGDIIDSMAFRFSDLAWGCSTVRDTTTLELSPIVAASNLVGAVYTSNTFYENFYATGGNSTFSRSSFVRSPLVPASLVPSLEFMIPTRPTQYLNMMAAFLPRITKVVSFLTSLL